MRLIQPDIVYLTNGFKNMPVYDRKRKVETGVQLEHTFKTYLEHVGQNIFRARPKITDYPAVTRSQIEQFLSNVNVFFFKIFRLKLQTSIPKEGKQAQNYFVSTERII